MREVEECFPPSFCRQQLFPSRLHRNFDGRRRMLRVRLSACEVGWQTRLPNWHVVRGCLPFLRKAPEARAPRVEYRRATQVTAPLPLS